MYLTVSIFPFIIIQMVNSDLKYKKKRLMKQMAHGNVCFSKGEIRNFAINTILSNIKSLKGMFVCLMINEVKK